MAISCLGFNTIALFSRQIFKIDDAPVNASLIFWFCFAEMICSVPRNSPMGDYQNIWLTGENSEPIGTIRMLAYEMKSLLKQCRSNNKKIRQPTRMLRQTRQPVSVFLIPVNQSKQLWYHSTPEYIWHHLPKITKTCRTGYTNHDRHKIKIEHDIID